MQRAVLRAAADAERYVAKSFKDTVVTVASQMFEVIDAAVRDCIGRSAPELNLIDLYWEFWKELKKRKGTASGFTGLSDYLVFNYVKFALEEVEAGVFNCEENTRDTNVFKCGRFVLAHDVDIRGLDPGLPKQRSDIALFLNLEGRKILLGVFEVKVYISSRSTLDRDLQKFRELGTQTDALMFPVLFNAQYEAEFNALTDEYQERARVISRAETYRNRIHLDDAVKRLLKAAQNVSAK